MSEPRVGPFAPDNETTATAVVPVEQKHMNLLQVAAASGNVEMFREAMKLQQEWDTYQARRLFAAAMVRAKADLPIISKSATVDFQSTKGRTFYRYADLAEVVATVSPILAREGIHATHRVSNTATHVTVTCVLEGYGHTEDHNTLTAPVDLSGNKNPVQAIASTTTYLQRYTLMAALGLAASYDDDGRGSATQGARRPPSAGGAPSTRSEPEDVEVHEIQETQQTEPGGPCEITGTGAKDWAAKYIAALKTAKDPRELVGWASINAVHLATLTTKYPDLRAKIDEVVNGLMAREPRRPPSAQSDAAPAGDAIDSAQWRKDMEGALSGCEDNGALEKYRQEIDNAPDGVLKADLDKVRIALNQAFDRINVGK